MKFSGALRVALPLPLRRVFDYAPAKDLDVVRTGVRVKVPLQKRTVVGVVCDQVAHSEVSISKLKAVTQVLDAEPVFSESVFKLLHWASTYYHHPVGEVLHTALPVALRRGGNLQPPLPRRWYITVQGGRGRAMLPERAVIQRQVLAELADAELKGVPEAALRAHNPRVLNALRRLEARGWVSSVLDDSTTVVQAHHAKEQQLTSAQSESCTQVVSHLEQYAAFLLHGVTGSGKTEVYLSIAREAIARNTQVLVLVPEIALTPQLVARFSQGLAGKLVVLHSGLGGRTRHRGWWAARQGLADVVLGTRSAVFTPCLRPGLIIVDEEHDPSFKQQEGFRYHARDVAVKRAQIEKIPVVLGSATPSLETLENVRKGRYSRLLLPQRVGGAVMPDVKLVDIARTAHQNGLSTAVLDAIETRLNRGEQSIIYVNRRGFAPVVLCLKCQWRAQCLRCDAGLTLHAGSGVLRCHHCGASQPAPSLCPNCAESGLYHLGEGTQRVEAALIERFPEARVVRVDSDSMAGPGQVEEVLETIRQREADIVVGTQMLSKGHHFAAVTLVCALNTDRGLYSFDFRASERLFQQLTQVAGRAGRGTRRGTVLVQTFYPDDPAYIRLQSHDFDGFATACLAERKAAGYPPYVRFVLLRAESPRQGAPLGFLQAAQARARRWLQAEQVGNIEVMDPVPSPMERRAGRFRAQLLVSGRNHNHLHRFLEVWLAELDRLKRARTVRWSVDVDPLDLY